MKEVAEGEEEESSPKVDDTRRYEGNTSVRKAPPNNGSLTIQISIIINYI
ncbi:hypothetical protein N9L68_08945 [bacterium]|nr:hypothetical protein [bacterium]